MKTCQPGRSAWWGHPYFTGNLAGTLLAGWVIKRLGFNRSYYLASLIFRRRLRRAGDHRWLLDMAELAFYRRRRLRDDLGGGGSALVCSGTSRSRGRLLAAYMMVYYVGTVLGQLMVSKLPTDLMSVLPW